MVEITSQMIIPIAMVLCFGYFIRRKKLGWVIFGVMMIGALLLLIPSISSETGGNPAIAKMGIAQLPALWKARKYALAQWQQPTGARSQPLYLPALLTVCTIAPWR
jgi:K+-transporting ATPase A subunit